MKIIVDKLPTKKEDCLFCYTNTLDNYNSHKCLLKFCGHEVGDGLHCSYGDGLHCSYNNCSLSQGLKCPYLKELFSQEDNDTAYVNDKEELIGI